MLGIIAEVIAFVTREEWRVIIVRGAPAVCQLVTVHGSVYANGCFR